MRDVCGASGTGAAGVPRNRGAGGARRGAAGASNDSGPDRGPRPPESRGCAPPDGDKCPATVRHGPQLHTKQVPAARTATSSSTAVCSAHQPSGQAPLSSLSQPGNTKRGKAGGAPRSHSWEVTKTGRGTQNHLPQALCSWPPGSRVSHPAARQRPLGGLSDINT